MIRLPCHVRLLAAVLCFASGAAACGMTTHTEIAHRSEVRRIVCECWRSVASDADLQGWFDDAQISSLLHDNVDAFEAGAPFPDWGYRCSNLLFAVMLATAYLPSN